MVKLTVRPIKGNEFQIEAELTQTVSLTEKLNCMCCAPP